MTRQNRLNACVYDQRLASRERDLSTIGLSSRWKAIEGILNINIERNLSHLTVKAAKLSINSAYMAEETFHQLQRDLT